MFKGQRDYSGVRISRHALERYVERFWLGDPADEGGAQTRLRAVISRARRLGRNPANGAVAALCAEGDRMLIAIIQQHVCTTVMTWPQFRPKLAEFGRIHLPRKPKRMMSRLRAVPTEEERGDG